METKYYLKDPHLMENDNAYSKYAPVGVCGCLHYEYGYFSRMTVGLPSLTFLLPKEIQYLRKGHMIMSTLLVLMVHK